MMSSSWVPWIPNGSGVGCVGEGGGGVASSQANGVGAAGGVVDGGAGGLGHRPLVPHLLAVVAAPEAHSDIVVVGQGDGLLDAEKKNKTKKKC